MLHAAFHRDEASRASVSLPLDTVILIDPRGNHVTFELKMESEGLFARDAPYRSEGCELLTLVCLLIVLLIMHSDNEHDDRGSRGGRGSGSRGGRGRDRRGGRWMRSRGGRGHRGGGASPRSQSQDEDGDFSMDDMERDTLGSKIR